jgi:hypothetical protein
METATFPRPEKRQRSDPDVEPDVQPQRSNVWLEDGNIVLEAQSVQFRVHKSVLASNSPIFRNMLQIPVPASQATLDNMPIVELHDSSTDVELMLKALYDRS